MLDLGCGAGKICFIASQVVGAAGRVIGVDLNDDMLALARGAAPVVAQRIGHRNVEFRKGRIQDLAVDLDALDGWLASHPVTDVSTLATLEAEQRRLRAEQPLVADGSVDAVVSNCVLNLVATEHKEQLFAETFRVLRRGGRAVISDIVSTVEVPDHLRADPELWSGCISGAYQEEAFLAAFERAGFYGVHLVKRDPGRGAWWTASSSAASPSSPTRASRANAASHGQAVIYCGPFKAVLDDDEHIYAAWGADRGVRQKLRDLLPGALRGCSSCCWSLRWPSTRQPRHCSTVPHRRRRRLPPIPPRWCAGRCPG